MTIREASHAGSWYSDDRTTLKHQLDEWLSQVDDEILGVGRVPKPGARLIIAPHAGYTYSGATAAWAYKSIDMSKAQRVFLLGPSHHHYLTNCALSTHTRYSTPLGDLRLDMDTISSLRSTGQFKEMSSSVDSNEHSLEMHLPYIYHTLSQHFTPENMPPLIPILVGNTSPATEKAFGRLLAPYLADPTTVFIVSSDFCHWGSRFAYTYYLSNGTADAAAGISLNSRDKPKDPPIHESIARIDKLAMQGVESGVHKDFLEILSDTGNTVCGRHPIGVAMSAIEVLKAEDKLGDGVEKGKFQFVRYERSNQVERGSDSSVSYASAVALINWKNEDDKMSCAVSIGPESSFKKEIFASLIMVFLVDIKAVRSLTESKIYFIYGKAFKNPIKKISAVYVLQGSAIAS